MTWLNGSDVLILIFCRVGKKFNNQVIKVEDEGVERKIILFWRSIFYKCMSLFKVYFLIAALKAEYMYPDSGDYYRYNIIVGAPKQV